MNRSPRQRHTEKSTGDVRAARERGEAGFRRCHRFPHRRCERGLPGHNPGKAPRCHTVNRSGSAALQSDAQEAGGSARNCPGSSHSYSSA